MSQRYHAPARAVKRRGESAGPARSTPGAGPRAGAARGGADTAPIQAGALERLGRTVLRGLEQTGRFVQLLARVGLWVGRGALEPRSTLQQMARHGVDSLPVIVVTGLFSGMVLAYQTSRQMVEFGAQSFVGGLVAVSLSREAAPVFSAVVMAGRTGSGIAAELGAMAVTEQIDALRALAIDPARYLAVPRALAGVVMLPVLTLFALVVGFLGGRLVAGTQGVNATIYMASVQRFLGAHDVTAGLIKAAVFGLIITLMGTFYGLRTTGGADGVGRSATGAVVASILVVLVTNYFLDVLLF